MQFNKCFGRDVIQCESIIYSGTFWYVCTCWPEITFRTLSKERFFKTSHYTRTLHFTLKRYHNSEGENSFQEKQCLLRKKIIYIFIKKYWLKKYSSGLNSNVTKLIQFFPQQILPYYVDSVLPPSSLKSYCSRCQLT